MILPNSSIGAADNTGRASLNLTATIHRSPAESRTEELTAL